MIFVVVVTSKHACH